MIGIAVGTTDFSDTTLKRLTQLGVDCIDAHFDDDVPGVREQGYPDLDALLKITSKVRSWGLELESLQPTGGNGAALSYAVGYIKGLLAALDAE